MRQQIALITLVVKDYDAALEFYTKKLSFTLVEDTYLPEEKKRWVVIAPPGDQSCQLLLGKAKNEMELKAVGNQTGGRVFLFLYTDDFWRDYHSMQEQDIEFVRPPKKESYGTVAVFKDLYGNLWDLLEPAQ